MEAGTRLGPYEITAQLGSGGMGEVYRAIDTRLGRTVAVKVIRSAEGADSEQRRRFRREAEIASRLTHPHICTLFDVGAEGEIDYLVLEHLDGVTLADRIARGPLSPEEALRRAGEVAEALAFAHAQGFVHRDLKPGNVFLTATGAKLLDFGLARASLAAGAPADSTANTAAAPLTEAGVICGTPAYMSPEQASGRAVDERSDQFALGCVLFEMLTGARAFRGASTVETLSAVLRDDPLARAEARALPRGVEGLLARLLAKEPADRYPTTRALADELHALGRSGTTLPPTELLPRPRRRRALAAAALVVAALGAAFLLWRSRRAPAAAIESVAVLPFETTASDAEAVLLADGMTESLINGLAELPSLRVMALSSVTAYRGRSADPREVGRALGVRAVLTGRLVPRGEVIAVSASLADASDGRHLWGTSYERSPSDVLGVQSELSRDLGLELRRRLTGAQRQRLARPATVDREAYLLFQKGRYSTGLRTRDGLLKSIDLFRQALERDPTYARAWAGLAESYDVLSYSGYLPPREGFPKAREAAKKALDADPALADAWAVLAHVEMLFDGDLARAEASFKKALALNPSCANAHHWYSHLLIQARRYDESLRESKAALEVDPLSLVMNLHLGEHYFLTGDTETAVAELRKTIEMDPRFGLAHHFLGLALRRLGDLDASIAEQELAVQLLPESSSVLAALGETYAQAGRRKDTEQVLARLQAAAAERYVSWLHQAFVLAALREKDATLDALERAMALGEPRATAMLRRDDSSFAFLRDDPRYRELRDRLVR